MLPVLAFILAAAFQGLAGDIFKYVPSGSIAVGRVDLKVLYSRPEVQKALNDADLTAKQAEFAAKTGCSIKDVSEAVVCINEKSKAILLIRLNKNIDAAAALNNYKKSFKVVPAGKFRILQIENDAALCQLDSSTVALGSPADLAILGNTAFGMPESIKKYAGGVENKKDTLCWLIFCQPGSAASCMFSLNFSGSSKQDYDFNAEFIFADAKDAAQFAAMVPMYAGMFSGMFFSARPELGAEIMKNLRVTQPGNSLKINLNVPSALADKILAYSRSEDVKKMLNNGAGKSAQK